jgi:hypothetical protein
MDSRNLRLVKEIWEVTERDGVVAGMEALIQHSHPDAEFRPYSSEGKVLRGADEIRSFFRERTASGATVHASPWSFEEKDDYVIVSGSVRVTRPDGSLADAQVKWTYSFRDGLVESASTGPLTD